MHPVFFPQKQGCLAPEQTPSPVAGEVPAGAGQVRWPCRKHSRSSQEQQAEANLLVPPETLSAGRQGVKGSRALWDQSRVEMCLIGPIAAGLALLHPSPVHGCLFTPSTGTGLPLSVTCSSAAGWETLSRPSLAVQEYQ